MDGSPLTITPIGVKRPPTMPFRISAKNLGHLALPDHCPRCFWLQARCGWKMPFAFFPGIFSSIDSYSKRVTNLHNALYSQNPLWLGVLGDLGQPIPVPHHTKFKLIDPETDILLTGVPDEMLQAVDGSITILDYKTARYTGHQDALLPIYQAQLNGYALIAESLGLGKVSGLALVYYEPVTGINSENLASVVQENGFSMGFTANILPVEVDRTMIPPLLQKAKALFDLPSPPEGRKGCRDCAALYRLMNMVALL